MKLKPILITFVIIAIVVVSISVGLEYKHNLDSEAEYRAYKIQMEKDFERRASLTRLKKENMEKFLSSNDVYTCKYTTGDGQILSDRASARLMKDYGGKFDIKPLNKGLELEVETNTKHIYKFKKEQYVYEVDQTVYNEDTVITSSTYEMLQKAGLDMPTSMPKGHITLGNQSIIMEGKANASSDNPEKDTIRLKISKIGEYNNVILDCRPLMK